MFALVLPIYFSMWTFEWVYVVKRNPLVISGSQTEFSHYLREKIYIWLNYSYPNSCEMFLSFQFSLFFSCASERFYIIPVEFFLCKFLELFGDGEAFALTSSSSKPSGCFYIQVFISKYWFHILTPYQIFCITFKFFLTVFHLLPYHQY